MRLYEIIGGGTQAPSGYLHVSRKALMSASSPSYGFREAYLAQWNGGDSRVSTLLSPLGWKAEHLLQMVSAHGLMDLDEAIDYRTDPRFHRLISDRRLQARMSELHSEGRAALLAYLDQADFLSAQKVAVVDVGWAGQIQEALELAIEGVERKPLITGLYLALRELGGQRRATGLDMQGLVFDCAEPNWRSECILSAVDVFEDACRAHHGTVTGYTNGEPSHAVATPSRLSEKTDEPRFSELHESVMRYAAGWSDALRRLKGTSFDTKSIADSAAVSLIRFPSAEVYRFFGLTGHSLDFGTDVALPSETAAPPFDPFGTLRGLRKAKWKEGYATGSSYRMALQSMLTLARILRGKRLGGCDGRFIDPSGRKTALERGLISALHFVARKRTKS
nr:hypothetical protein [Neorhizobium tomejilense]